MINSKSVISKVQIEWCIECCVNVYHSTVTMSLWPLLIFVYVVFYSRESPSLREGVATSSSGEGPYQVARFARVGQRGCQWRTGNIRLFRKLHLPWCMCACVCTSYACVCVCVCMHVCMMCVECVQPWIASHS